MKADLALTLQAQGGKRGGVLLVEMQLETPLYFSNAAVDIEHGGQTYIGVEQLEVEPLREQAGEVEAMSFTLPAVPNAYLTLALQTPINGKRVKLSLALLDPETQAIVRVQQLWAGQLDQMPVEFGPDTAGISVTAEHRAITYGRPKPLRYTDAEQRRLYPGDRGLEYLIDQSQKEDIWPSREFFKQ